MQRAAALAAAGRGEHESAAELVAEAIDAQPELTGRVNGEPLGSLRDMDDQLGSVLEVFAGGRYLWLPLEHIARLKAAPPRHLLDLLWLPAELTDRDGATSIVHLPVLYEGSSRGDGDPRCATGRVTEWYATGGELERGRGQRLLGWSTPAGERGGAARYSNCGRSNWAPHREVAPWPAAKPSDVLRHSVLDRLTPHGHAAGTATSASASASCCRPCAATSSGC